MVGIAFQRNNLAEANIGLEVIELGPIHVYMLHVDVCNDVAQGYIICDIYM